MKCHMFAWAFKSKMYYSVSQKAMTFASIMLISDMVAGTGVPMKVDTGLFTSQPIQSDPIDSCRREYKHGVSCIAKKKNDMTGFATQ